MFSSKPVVRTTDPVLLKQKAIAFLDKNYTRLKNGEIGKREFYMLEPNSENGIKRVIVDEMFIPNDANGIRMNPMKIPIIDKQHECRDIYTDKNGVVKQKNIIRYIYRRPDNDVDKAMWTRNMSGLIVGNSARDVVLGGTRRRKSRRRQRKSYKR
jgi:hypothetical protein